MQSQKIFTKVQLTAFVKVLWSSAHARIVLLQWWNVYRWTLISTDHPRHTTPVCCPLWASPCLHYPLSSSRTVARPKYHQVLLRRPFIHTDFFHVHSWRADFSPIDEVRTSSLPARTRATTCACAEFTAYSVLLCWLPALAAHALMIRWSIMKEPLYPNGYRCILLGLDDSWKSHCILTVLNAFWLVRMIRRVAGKVIKAKNRLTYIVHYWHALCISVWASRTAARHDLHRSSLFYTFTEKEFT